MRKKQESKLLTSVVTFEEVKEDCLRDERVKKNYNALGFKYALIDAELTWRKKHNINQGKLAELIGQRQQDISRFEKGENVTIDLISKIFSVMGACIVVE